ncbi:hypothetical protein N826_31630 [Skermanella aerolata KACC 11604]|jgi:hypothetical protein|nr:hypothetical protein N826_31630 [Skermanella aerolata KACC 11604]
MGAILELVDMMKSPLGIVAALIAASAVYLFVRWVLKD